MVRKIIENNPNLTLSVPSALLILALSVTIPSSDLTTSSVKSVFATTGDEDGGEGSGGAEKGGGQQGGDRQSEANAVVEKYQPLPFGRETALSSENKDVVEQPRLSDNVGDLVAPPTSNPTEPDDETGIVEGPLPDTLTTQRAPDTLFSGRDAVPADVPLRDPVLVPGPNEERADEEEDKEECVVPLCDVPFQISQDEICRNGQDDNLDGRVDEDPYCTEVPGQSKPRSPDSVLTPETSTGTSPFGSPPK